MGVVDHRRSDALKPLSIATVGASAIDLYLESQQAAIGGTAVNVAINAKQCGANSVSIISAVGTDRAGEAIREELLAECVDCSHLSVLSGMTPQQSISMCAGERVYPPESFKSGILELYTLRAADLTFISGHDIIALSYHPEVRGLLNSVLNDSRCEPCHKIADFGDIEEQRIPDVVKRFQGCLDVMFVSGSCRLVEVIQRLQPSKALIVVTFGSDGSCAIQDGKVQFERAVTVEAPLDTTGCGDAFQAAFAVAYFRNGDVRDALRKGAARAAQVITHYGAIAGSLANVRGPDLYVG